MAHSIFTYWAKSGPRGDYHSVPAHLLDVAATGIAYLRNHPGLRTNWATGLSLQPLELENLLGWGLAIHDIGKFCDRFQGCHPDLFPKLWPNQTKRPYNPHHTTLGSILLNKRVIPRMATELAIDHPWSAAEWRHVLWAFQPPFTGHHGEPPEAIDYRSDIWDEAGMEAAEQWVAEIATQFPLGALWRDGPSAAEVVDNLRAASWHFAGFAVLSDWIGSNNAWFPSTSEPFLVETYWEAALAAAHKAIEASGVLPTAVGPPLSMRDMFSKEPTPLQRAIETWQPLAGEAHLVIIEDTTGAGKTEASILAAHRLMSQKSAEGLYFALPTQATANAMYSRMRQGAHRLYVEPSEASLVLAHSGYLPMREFRQRAIAIGGTHRNDEGQLECAEWLADSRKKAFLAHVGVGTIDQALLGVLAVRHQSLRLFGLTTRVLIVDEVHAYDTHATQLLETLIRFHTRAGGSTILLSATMPGSLRERFVKAFSQEVGSDAPQVLATRAYPLLTVANGLANTETPLDARKECERSITISFRDNFQDIVELVRHSAAQGQNVCWIRNTVQEAADAWNVLADAGAMLFHSRFTETDRQHIESDVLRWSGPDSTPEQRRGRILVATQVVEQSLDVDFDVLITDLAPIDLILQRAGRLHRHAHRVRPGSAEPTLVIFGPSWSETPDKEWVRGWSRGSAAVYPDHGRLWLGLQMLRRKGTITIPADLRPAIETVYGEEAPRQIPSALQSATSRAEVDDLAHQSHAQAKILRIDEGYQSRDGKWDAPERARTRAGEPSLDIHLAVEIDGNAQPLLNDPAGWPGSRVKVPVSLAMKAGLLDATTATESVGVKHILCLENVEKNQWIRKIVVKDHKFTIHYDRRAGLSIKQEEQQR